MQMCLSWYSGPVHARKYVRLPRDIQGIKEMCFVTESSISWRSHSLGGFCINRGFRLLGFFKTRVFFSAFRLVPKIVTNSIIQGRSRSWQPFWKLLVPQALASSDECLWDCHLSSSLTPTHTLTRNLGTEMTTVFLKIQQPSSVFNFSEELEKQSPESRVKSRSLSVVWNCHGEILLSKETRVLSIPLTGRECWVQP